jgi:tRNA threonylcarbamoyl adenosine modification protein YeaZ
MKKYALAIHTTTGQLGLCLSNFTGDNRSQVWELGRDLSNYLHQHLREFIKPQTWSDLGFIAVAKGPGSFTSTRIGVVMGRTLAQQLNIPVYGISTLATLAWSRREKYHKSLHLALEMKASRGQLFVAIYQQSSDGDGLITHLNDTLITPEKWQEILTNWPADYRLIKAADNLGHTVDSLLELAYFNWQQNQSKHWQQLLPFYGQNPA